MTDMPGNKRVCMIILDGWGVSMNFAGNAIRLGDPKIFDNLMKNYGHKILNTFDKNKPFSDLSLKSEVCHTQISAGRFIQSEQELIYDEIKRGLHLSNPAIINAFKFAVGHDSKVHLICPLDEDKHSIDCIRLIVDASKNFQQIPLLLHLIATKNTDLSQTQALIEKVYSQISQLRNCKIASLSGGNYTCAGADMKNSVIAHEAIIGQSGKQYFEIKQIIDYTSEQDCKSDEIEPSVIVDNGKPVGPINDFDSLIFSAISADPIKLLFSSFINDLSISGSVRKYNLNLTSFTDYFHTDKLKYNVVFKITEITPNLTQILSKNGITQVHIAESSKEDNVGFYFDGRTSTKSPEEKVLSVSGTGVTPDNPKMSAEYITKVAIDQMRNKGNVFLLVNFANVDYFAHTKDIRKTSQAVKCIDDCLLLLYDAAAQSQFTLVITSDHGNAESMASVNEVIKIDEHSKNPVPFIVVSETTKRASYAFDNGHANISNMLNIKNSICDIAPTILDLFGIKPPEEFSGSSLINILE